MIDPKERQFDTAGQTTPESRESRENWQDIDLEHRETEGIVVETVEQDEARVGQKTEPGGGGSDQISENSARPESIQAEFDPQLAYTTAAGEAERKNIAHHIIENVDYTKPDGAAHKVLEELISGDTVEKI